jgi:hypothetical protein
MAVNGKPIGGLLDEHKGKSTERKKIKLKN